MSFIYDLLYNAIDAFITALVVVPLNVLTEFLIGLVTQ